MSQIDYLTVLATGQSNMVGSLAIDGGDLTVNNKMSFWNGTSWECALAYRDNMGGVYRNNIAFHFAKRLQEDTGKEVRILLAARGATAIVEGWVGDDSLVYSDILTQVEDSGTTKIDYVLWHQGEQDSGLTNAAYGGHLNTVVGQFRAEDSISVTAPIIFGELREAGLDAQNVVFNDLGTYVTDSYVYTATCKELADIGDGVHYTGTSIMTMGRTRYHAAVP